MIAYLHGTLAEATPTRVVVDCHGVGYAVAIPVSSYDQLPPVGSPVKLLTHHHVSGQDGAVQLFGFATASERAMFLLLIDVSGIGPRTALNILSSTTLDALRTAIAEGDVPLLASVRGIGKKTAERLVVELKDRVGPGTPLAAIGRAATAADQRLADAVLALVSLGYKQADAQKTVLAVAAKAGAQAGPEELVRAALRAG
ncbi:Holliday junction branch migration protein RuvA [bacterium]|nr:Holliday junction branch migration protein RuvA [bacterium]